MADAAGLAALVGGADRLACILDHGQVVALGELEDRVHVDALPEDVHGHDRARPVGDRRLELRHVHVVGAGLDVDEDRRRTDVRDRLGGREEGERRGDDLVALADAHRRKDQEQRVGAVGTGHRVLGAAVVRHRGLEGLDLRPADEPGRAHRLGPHLIELGLELAVLCLQVEQRDSHHASVIAAVWF